MPNMKKFSENYAIWCRFIEAAGHIKLGTTHINPKTLKISSKQRRKKDQTIIKQIPKHILPPGRVRPEAGIIVVTTPNIIAKDLGRKQTLSDEHKSSHELIETEINNNIFMVDKGQGYNRVTFKTKKYFEEGLRISMNPSLVRRGELHPLQRFHPQNYTDMSTLVENEKDIYKQMLTSNLTFVLFPANL